MNSYSANKRSALHWASWDDEYVVFDEASGQTHQLDALRAYVVDAVSSSQNSFAELLGQLCALSPTNDPYELSKLLTTALRELCVSGLVEESIQ